MRKVVGRMVMMQERGRSEGKESEAAVEVTSDTEGVLGLRGA